LQQKSGQTESESWNEIGEVLDAEMSTVEDIRADLARNDKGSACQTIDNCMMVFHRDPLLKGRSGGRQVNILPLPCNQ
jgi:hypothetical protein